MRTRLVWAATWLMMATLGACEIHESHYAEEGWSESDDVGGPAGGGYLCEDYCWYLEQCEAISSDEVAACWAACSGGMQSDPWGTEEACYCTLQQSCDDVVDDPCDGTPVPPDDGPGGGDAGGGGGGGLGAGGADPGAGGGDAGIPCDASCECPEGMRCVEGICVGGEPPPSCESNCDCPAGEYCSDGICTAP